MQQYLIIGLNDFGGRVIERARALPLDASIVYHRLDCAACPVEGTYLEYRRQLLDVLNHEVYNFSNTHLTVYLAGLLIQEHMADDLIHLGYLFKTFFRENIILNPRMKVLTAMPAIIPEEAYGWLPATQQALGRIDHFASLKEPFQPAYTEVQRALPSISGPPFDEIVFCYSESLDDEDLAVTAQAAATKIYFDIVVLPARAGAEEKVAEFYRNPPAAQGYAPVTGTSVAFMPSLRRLVADEMELMIASRLWDRFLPAEPPRSADILDRVDGVLEQIGARQIREVVAGIVTQALEREKWFDLAALDTLAAYNVETSLAPDTCLAGFMQTLERERNRYAGRVRDLVIDAIERMPERLAAAIRERHPEMDLREIDTLFTFAFHKLADLPAQSRSLAQEARDELDRARREIGVKTARLREIVSARSARMKKGGETEARIREVLETVSVGALLRCGLMVTAAEAVSQDTTLDGRIRESYARMHAMYEQYLGRRPELLAHFANRRDAYVARGELSLFVLRQLFRRRLLDAQIHAKIDGLLQDPSAQPLRLLAGKFLFEKWWQQPDMPLDEVERGMIESVRVLAGTHVERMTEELTVDHRELGHVLRDVARDQAGAIFDRKYLEHPQAAFREAIFVCHKEPDVSAALADAPFANPDLTDVAHVPALPYQVLLVSELYNLPFRALRQYDSMARGKVE
ncbi:MAG: hypothetical protein HYX75_04540 [Acidobacteria bacterium]|nr:hypothetical protein [Acidobacteriota bacterium]